MELRRILVLLLLFGALPAMAGEGQVVKVRGKSLSINKGAEDGLTVGLMVNIVRPPSESYIHPVTGENLGAPEIKLTKGEVTKVSGRAASVRLQGNPILPVQTGDIVRFVTVEEDLVIEQQRAVEKSDKASSERRVIRNDASLLTREVKNIQGSIRTFEKMMKRLERVDEAIKVQLRGINNDMMAVKEDLKDLKETVSLMGAVSVDDIGEDGTSFDEADIVQMRDLIKEELENVQAQIPLENSYDGDTMVDDSDLSGENIDEDVIGDLEVVSEEQEAKPFYKKIWFYIVLLVLGLGVLGYFLYDRLLGGDGDDEELAKDDEYIDEDDEDDEFVIEDEEDDDIVIEETT